MRQRPSAARRASASVICPEAEVARIRATTSSPGKVSGTFSRAVSQCVSPTGTGWVRVCPTPRHCDSNTSPGVANRTPPGTASSDATLCSGTQPVSSTRPATASVSLRVPTVRALGRWASTDGSNPGIASAQLSMPITSSAKSVASSDRGVSMSRNTS